MNAYASHRRVRRCKPSFAPRALLFAALCGQDLCGQSTETKVEDSFPNSQFLSERVQMDARRLQATEQFDERLRQMLASIPQSTPAAVASVKEKSNQLAVSLAAAENALRQLQNTNPTNAPSVADLDMQLTDVEAERDKLVNKQTEELAGLSSTNGSKGLRHEVVLEKLKPIYLLLVKNRVVPIMQPFYSVEAARFKMALTGEIVDGIIATRVAEGESIGNAVGRRGLCGTFMRRSDPKTAYIRVGGCADSIPAFERAVDAVSQRGFAYAWETGKDQPFKQILNRNADLGKTRGYNPAEKK